MDWTGNTSVSEYVDTVIDDILSGKLEPDTEEGGLTISKVAAHLKVSSSQAEKICNAVNQIVSLFKKSQE